MIGAEDDNKIAQDLGEEQMQLDSQLLRGLSIEKALVQGNYNFLEKILAEETNKRFLDIQSQRDQGLAMVTLRHLKDPKKRTFAIFGALHLPGVKSHLESKNFTLIQMLSKDK